jgi:FkbM family methyltransferase
LELVPNLIYDVGANNGDDTAYYLFKGYDVVAIEADPTLMAPLKARFPDHVADGRLKLVNIALAPTREKALFWICEGYSLWNSFDREIASRNGRQTHAVELECWPLRDVFSRYGVPGYLKMSLHGDEHFCLADIRPKLAPAYISLELPRDLGKSAAILSRLSELGYSKFKIIDQTSQRQLTNTRATLASRLRERLRKYPSLHRTNKTITQFRKRLTGPDTVVPTVDSLNASQDFAQWVFPEGSSGPFGQETHGQWQTASEASETWKAFLLGNSKQGLPRLSIWHDLHAEWVGAPTSSAS